MNAARHAVLSLLALALLAGSAAAQTLDTGKIGHWKLDEGSGTTALDASPSAMNGTLTNGPAWSTIGLPAIHGGNPSCLAFDGTNDYVDNIVDNYEAVHGAFTMAFWANPSATRTFTPEATTTGGASGQRYAIYPFDAKDLWTHNDSGAGVSVGTNGVSVVDRTGSGNYGTLLVSELTISGWTHIAVVYTANRPSLYVNGVFVRTGLASSRLRAHPSPFLGGHADGVCHYQGELDEVRVYNRTLSDPEIQALALGRNDLDTTAPAAVTLAPSGLTHGEVTLNWSAPANDGQDGTTGPATLYDLRHSASVIDSPAKFAAATPMAGLAAPGTPGAAEAFAVPGLDPHATYHFCLRTADSFDQWSALSNSLAVTTPDDLVAPSPTLLAVTFVDDSKVELTWTAPGNDAAAGMARGYDLRISTLQSIATPADFAAAAQVHGLPHPQLGGTTQTFTVVGLMNNTTYHFCLKSVDGQPNWSAMSNSLEVTTLDGGSNGSGTPCSARIGGAWTLFVLLALVPLLRR